MSTKADAPTAHEQFAALHADIRASLAALAHEWAAGELSSGPWSERMDAVLLEAHTQAVVIGRQHGGDLTPREADDQGFAVPIVAAENDFLQGFRQALERGEYDNEDGSLDGEGVAARAERYAGRLTGTANQAWTLTLPADEQIVWLLGAEDSSNCDACPAIADGSPYDASSFDIWPGSNQTPCLSSCRCSLVTEAGEQGFTTP